MINKYCFSEEWIRGFRKEKKYPKLYAMLKKPTVQIAQLVPTRRDLVFANTQTNAEKPKSLSRIYIGELFFC